MIFDFLHKTSRIRTNTTLRNPLITLNKLSSLYDNDEEKLGDPENDGDFDDSITASTVTTEQFAVSRQSKYARIAANV